MEETGGKNVYEGRLTGRCAGECLFAHDECLDVRIDCRGPIDVVDGHDVVYEPRFEELEEAACTGYPDIKGF